MPEGAPLATSKFVVGTLGEIVDLAKRERGAALLAVLNVTPDSFFDGGKHLRADHAKRRIDELMAQGADVIDIGAESTRPGATPVSTQEQIDRAGAAVAYAQSQGAVVSVDTTNPEVAEATLGLGASIINDVSCLTDPRLADVARRYDADLIIMHSRGEMSQMPGFSIYDESAYKDIVADVCSEWEKARAKAEAQGLNRERIWFDPGLGFHKSARHSRELMTRLGELRCVDAPLVIGASRKSFLGSIDDSPPDQRLGASIAAAILAVAAGAAVVRVHDVKETRQALLAYRALSSRSFETQAKAPREAKLHA